MGSWNRLMCMHGITEDLDFHSCSKCQQIAAELEMDVSNGQTYIFTSKAQVNRFKKKLKKEK
jgi:hypothetical protein